MKTTSHDFHNFVKYQCLKNLSSYEHTDRGKFYPSVGLIELNVDAKTFHEEKNSKSYQPWKYSYMHESIHLYHLYGSSLGFLEVGVNDIQHLILNHLIGKYKKSSYSTFKNFINSPAWNPFNMLNNGNTLSDLIELRTLFGSGYDYLKKNEQLYMPKVKDYLQQIYIFYELYLGIKKHETKKAEMKKCVIKLCDELIPRSNALIDCAIDASIFPETMEDINFPLNYCLLSEEKVWLFSTRAIVEGYATFIESLIKSEDPRIKNLPDYYVPNICQADSFGIYGVANQLLFCVLQPDLTTMSVKFVHTCFAIYELSLMTRLYPKLLLGSNELSYEELFVPHRFVKVLSHLVERRSNIYDYCKSIHEISEGMDAICDELNWMRYTDCLQILYEDATTYNVYASRLMRSFIAEKIMGNIFPFTETYSEKILSRELIVATKDVINFPESCDREEYFTVLTHLLKDLFSRYVLYDYDLSNISRFIEKYFIKHFGKELTIYFLKHEGLDELIDIV